MGTSPEAAAGTSRKPTAALVLGIAGLVTGFALVTLLAAVAAITLASLALQEIWDGRGDPARQGMTVAGMVCGIVALVIWIPVIAAVALSET